MSDTYGNQDPGLGGPPPFQVDAGGSSPGYAGDRSVSFVESFGLFFKNYVNFSGRSSRAAYWWWMLWIVMISVVLSIVDGFIVGFDSAATAGPLGGIFSLITLIPSIALSVRRLHDINRRGWWLLLTLIPIIGWIILFVWSVTQGDKGANGYGPDVEAGKV